MIHCGEQSEHGRIRIDPPISLCFAQAVRIFLWFLAAVFLNQQLLHAQVAEIPDAPSVRGGSDPVRIVQELQPGNTYRFISYNLIRMQLPGKGIREATVEHQTRIDSSPRPDGRAGVSVRARIERLKVDFRSGDKRVTYDSFNQEDRSSQLGQHFRNSLNRWVDLKMSQNLEILGVTFGGREGLGTLLPGVPQFGLHELEKLIAEIPQGLPETKVRPGEVWQINGLKEVNDLGELNFNVTYRYMGVGEHEGIPCFDIQIGGQLGGEALIPKSGGNMADRNMSFQGASMSGKILFDPALSTVRFKERTVSMLMELPGEKEGELVQIPVQQQATIRLLHMVPTKQ